MAIVLFLAVVVAASDSDQLLAAWNAVRLGLEHTDRDDAVEMAADIAIILQTKTGYNL
jgi:hypothetical protein